MSRTAADIATVYDRRAPEILRYLARRAPDPEVAVDLLAETFAVAIAKRRSFRGTSDEELVGWIYAIARSRLSDFWRRGRLERRAADRLGIERRPMTDEEYDRVEQLMDLEDVRARLGREVDLLPATHRQALQLRIVDELPYPEVARAIGTTEQNARARVSRALAALRATPVMQELEDQPRHA